MSKSKPDKHDVIPNSIPESCQDRIHELTQPRGYDHAIDALDGVTDARHHRVDLLSQIILSIQS